MSDIADVSLRQAALIAGIGYLVVFAFGYGNVRRDKLVVRGDAAATASNIRASESRFRVGIATWVVTLAADLVVAWALYFFLKPVSESLSLLTAWLRLVYVAIAALPVINLLLVPLLLSSADDPGGTQPVQRDAQATLLLRSFDFGLNVGFVFFGLLGEQTRDYDDLDTVLKHKNASRFLDAVRRKRYEWVRDDGPMRPQHLCVPAEGYIMPVMGGGLVLMVGAGCVDSDGVPRRSSCV